MSRVVYLHVGAPKTGTTYLQDRILKNREQLADHGFHYPVGLGSGHFMAALDLIQMRWGGQLGNAAGQWDTLAARVNRIDDTSLISHEILAAAKPPQVQRAMDSLKDADEVHVVYTARDLARQVPAEWQESVKHRRRHTYKRFLDTIVDTQARPSTDQWFWRVQAIPEVLSRWGAHVSPSNVHLVVVPPAGAPKNLLWERFCSAVRIEPAWAPTESKKVNQSIGAAETTLLRRLNVRLKGELDSAAYRRLIRQLMVHKTLAHRSDMHRVTLPPRLDEWAANLAEEWIGWIQDSGIDVHGDLDELRPEPHPDGERWLDPDTANTEEMTDAALDALAVMTRAAAQGGANDDSLKLKVKKVVRRARMSRL